jgi:hypothetical protein
VEDTTEGSTNTNTSEIDTISNTKLALIKSKFDLAVSYPSWKQCKSSWARERSSSSDGTDDNNDGCSVRLRRMVSRYVDFSTTSSGS